MGQGMNRVTLLGHLGADPELRYTPSGTAVLHFRMATNESYMDKKHELQERTEWHSIVVWGNRGEALAKVLVKGDLVLVEGGLRTSSYEKDGVKRYRTEVHASEVHLTGRTAKREDSSGGSALIHVSKGRNGAGTISNELPQAEEMPF